MGGSLVLGVLITVVGSREGGGVGTGTALRVRGVRRSFLAAGDNVVVAEAFGAAPGFEILAAAGFEVLAVGFRVEAAGFFATGLETATGLGLPIVEVVAGRAGSLGWEALGRKPTVVREVLPKEVVAGRIGFGFAGAEVERVVVAGRELRGARAVAGADC